MSSLKQDGSQKAQEERGCGQRPRTPELEPAKPGPLVLKFGGTSVEDADAIGRVVHIIQARVSRCQVVVVSALAGATDQLLRAGEAAAASHLDAALGFLDALERRHRSLAEQLRSPVALALFSQLLEKEFQNLRELLAGVAALGEFTARTSDRVLGVGEILSSKLLVEVLRQAGLNPEWLDSRKVIVTNEAHGSAQPLRDQTHRRLRSIVAPLALGGRLPVLPGFIGATLKGVPTTLGRGGSDFSAAIVAAALEASALEIWTDVDGIMTADPRLCPDAQLIPAISFEEASELASFGAKVLHPSTLLPAMKQGIPVLVRNSRQPDRPGTRVFGDVGGSPKVQAITAKRGMALVHISSHQHTASDLVRQALNACDRHKCVVELFSAARGGVSLLVQGTNALPHLVTELEGVADVRWENHKALICFFGGSDRNQRRSAEHALRTLSDLDVSLLSQGGSERRIGLLVDEDHVAESVCRLHGLFFPDALLKSAEQGAGA